jgi:hypothetical protein
VPPFNHGDFDSYCAIPVAGVAVVRGGDLVHRIFSKGLRTLNLLRLQTIQTDPLPKSFLDYIPNSATLLLYILSHPAREGRFMRRLEAERIELAALEIRRSWTRWPTVSAGAAPAREVRSLTPGRYRDPTGRQDDRSAGSLLDWDSETRRRGLHVPGSADPASVRRIMVCLAKPHVERRKAWCLFA